MKIRFPASIKLGRLLVDDRRSFDKNLLSFPNKARVIVTVGLQKKDRSLKQNRYYWGVPIKMISDYTGFTPDEAHLAMKMQFLQKKDAVIPTVISTTALSTKEFEEYLENIRRFAATKFAMNIPDPNQVEL